MAQRTLLLYICEGFLSQFCWLSPTDGSCFLGFSTNQSNVYFGSNLFIIVWALYFYFENPSLLTELQLLRLDG